MFAGIFSCTPSFSPEINKVYLILSYLIYYYNEDNDNTHRGQEEYTYYYNEDNDNMHRGQEEYTYYYDEDNDNTHRGQEEYTYYYNDNTQRTRRVHLLLR